MIIVFGSISVDMVMRIPHLPDTGDRIHTDTYSRIPGGKGATQAIAAARMGAKTAMVGKVGQDGFGTQMLNKLKGEGILCSGVPRSDYTPTGVNIVMKTPERDKNIIAISGANHEAFEDQVPNEILTPQNYVLFQMEVKHDQNWTLIQRAKEQGAITALNLAPAGAVPDQVLEDLDYICVNREEAKFFSKHVGGLDIEAIAAKYELNVIVTLSERGAIMVKPDGTQVKGKAIDIGDEMADTLGSGDVFCGAFFACLHNGKSDKEAIQIACAAASLNCKTAGAQEGIPFYGDIKKLFESKSDS